MSAGLIQEQDGATSSRRFLAVVSYFNAIALSWFNGSWESIAIFAGATLILLGLTTVQDLKAIAQYRVAGAVGGASVYGETQEPIGFKEV